MFVTTEAERIVAKSKRRHPLDLVARLDYLYLMAWKSDRATRDAIMLATRRMRGV